MTGLDIVSSLLDDLISKIEDSSPIQPINNAKSGCCSKLILCLLIWSFFMTSSIYLVVENKNGPVTTIIDSALSKEKGDFLISCINDLAPLVYSIKRHVKYCIQKVLNAIPFGKEEGKNPKDLNKEDFLRFVVKR